jgi:hypothetical protein
MVKGVFDLPVTMLGHRLMHPFQVIKGLNKSIILGADFINKHLLMYDPKFKQVNWRNEKHWTVSPSRVTHKVTVPKYSTK